MTKIAVPGQPLTSVDAIANLKVRSELDWLVYEAPTDYVRLVLIGELEKNLQTV